MGFPSCSQYAILGYMESNPAARVVALLEEAKDELATGVHSDCHPEIILRGIDKITQAQNLIVGGELARPEDN